MNVIRVSGVKSRLPAPLLIQALLIQMALPSSTDSDGHGTTCAGIAAGGEQMWSDIHWSGVAPGVKIVMCKVARIRNSFENGALIQALQFLLKSLKEFC